MEDEEIILDFFHEHPLRLLLPNVVEKIDWQNWCCGCWRFFLPGEAVYGCSLKCDYKQYLHKECVKMPREIRHPLHTSHPLTLGRRGAAKPKCLICDLVDYNYSVLGYTCSQSCEELWIHMVCAGAQQPVAMEDEEIILDFFHEHPLRLLLPNVVEKIGRQNWCCGCWRFFLPGEAVYGCSLKCDYKQYLHKECAKMPREIRHPLHTSHPLTLGRRGAAKPKCVICDLVDYNYSVLGYTCSQSCEELWIHLVCAGAQQVAVIDRVMKHPSHPQHELRFLRRSSSFKCDACGTTEEGNSYMCIICCYWIHETCASLKTTHRFHHHHHSLSLAFYLPFEYIYYEYTCSICSGALRLRHWVYHCEICRYVAHIKCATNAATSNTIYNENATDDDDHNDILKTPMNDLYEELIKPFVKREKGKIIIPSHDNAIINTYKFHKHDHPLRFTTFSSSSSSHHHNEEEDEDDDGREGSEATCDGCIVEINKKSCGEGYMSCDECKYFLHVACFNLPPLLPSHPLHKTNDHTLSLENVPNKLADWKECYCCGFPINGLFYSCTKCDFILDIKCASLLDTIKHAAHPQHRHYLKLVADNHVKSVCSSCYEEGGDYKCDNCIFAVCYKCVLLPARNKHRLENHWMPLTYDACVDRPGEFYCSNCETQMNPRSWMYHCRDCDQSFHPRCFPTTSGYYRNINFGRQYQVNHHPHQSLRFQIISKKKHCDVCHSNVYDFPGFQCTSCNFVKCYDGCHKRGVVQLIN